MQLPLIDGPGWTGFGVVESPGRYPLRVDGAVSSIVGRLLPGVITTTRHARMYAVHTLGWAEANERGSNYVHEGVFELHRAAEPNQLSVNGFAGVYQGPCVSVGAITDELYPRPGQRADVAAVREGLGDLIELADTAEVTLDDLRSQALVCLCEAADCGRLHRVGRRGAVAIRSAVAAFRAKRHSVAAKPQRRRQANGAARCVFNHRDLWWC